MLLTVVVTAVSLRWSRTLSSMPVEKESVSDLSAHWQPSPEYDSSSRSRNTVSEDHERRRDTAIRMRASQGKSQTSRQVYRQRERL